MSSLPPQLQQCLFCSKICSEATAATSQQLKGGMVGAVRCPTLERHLLQIFILRQLLDLPSAWCEETLQAQDENGAPDSWFRICSGCVAKWVGDAWHIYQKMLDLEGRMKAIKEGIKGSMERNLRKNKGRGGGGRLLQGGTGVEAKIKALIFPDLMKTSPTKSRRPRPEASLEGGHFLDDFFLDEAYRSPFEDDEDELYEDDEDDFKGYGKTTPKRMKSKAKAQRGKKGIKRKLSANKKAKTIWRYCTKCSTRFSDPQELESHLIAHEESEKTGGMFSCEICTFPARDSRELELHTNHRHVFKKVPKTNSCSRCDFISLTWIGLKAHFQAEHPDVPEEETADFELRCTLCMKDFETRSTLVIHQKKMHPEMFGSRQESIPCDQCSQLFPSLIHLQYHVRSTHSRITRYVCDTCGKGFRFSKSLDRHKISHEKGKREFICDICGCDYSYQSILDDHYRKIHPDVAGKGNAESNPNCKPDIQAEFSCKYCDMKSPYKPVILRHMETHKAEMGHQCDLCGKYYLNVQGLRRHKRINHSTTNEVVKCPHCFKEFPTVDYMKTHVTKYCKLKRLQKESTTNPTSSANMPLEQVPLHQYSTEVILPSVKLNEDVEPDNNATATATPQYIQIPTLGQFSSSTTSTNDYDDSLITVEVPKLAFTARHKVETGT